MKTVIFLAVLQAAALASTIHVPGDHATIQDGIDAAVNGDTVLVAPGTYNEDIDFLGKAITVKSSGGSSATVIAGTGTSSVVTFQDFEGRDSVLHGFTVRNGDPNGLQCLDAAPTIQHNRITGHRAHGIQCTAPSFQEGPLIEYNTISANGGSGIDEFSDAVIRNNNISNNREFGIHSDHESCALIEANTISSNAFEGIRLLYANRSVVAGNTICDNARGITCFYAWPEIYGNSIFNNSNNNYGGGILCYDYATCWIADNLIRDNEAALGGGIYLKEDSYCTLLNNTIVDNTATIMGGGVGVANYYGMGSPWATLTDCILRGNTAPNGPALSIVDNSVVRISYCNLEGGLSSVYLDTGYIDWGDGMIDADPLFADPVNGDFRLQQDPCQPGVTNPCVDTGSRFSMNLNLHQASTRTDGVPDSGMADMGMHLGDYHLPVWSTDTCRLSASTGGTITFSLRPGTGYAGRNYLVLGSVSGTVPGTPLPGGFVILPLNWDVFTDLALGLVNTPAFQEFMGQSPQFKTPLLQTGPFPGAAGISLYFAYTMNNPFDFASHPMRIDIVP
jgi:parallel beta-helix repeat protein